MCAKPRLRTKSFRDYEGLLRRYVRPQLGSCPLVSVQPFDIQSLYRELLDRGPSARTIRYAHAVLSSALKQAVHWKLLLANPADLVDLPRQTRRGVGALTVPQARAFITAIAGYPYEALFALAMTTGMRLSEYLALTWADIDLERGTASVSRTLECYKGG
jgi:integrase